MTEIINEDYWLAKRTPRLSGAALKYKGYKRIYHDQYLKQYQAFLTT